MYVALSLSSINIGWCLPEVRASAGSEFLCRAATRPAHHQRGKLISTIITWEHYPSITRESIHSTVKFISGIFFDSGIPPDLGIRYICRCRDVHGTVPIQHRRGPSVVVYSKGKRPTRRTLANQCDNFSVGRQRRREERGYKSCLAEHRGENLGGRRHFYPWERSVRGSTGIGRRGCCVLYMVLLVNEQYRRSARACRGTAWYKNNWGQAVFNRESSDTILTSNHFTTLLIGFSRCATPI